MAQRPPIVFVGCVLANCVLDATDASVVVSVRSDAMAEEKVEAPEQIWLTEPYYDPLRSALRIVHEQPPPIGRIKYHRFRHRPDCPEILSMAIDACTCNAPNTRQRTERAAAKIADAFGLNHQRQSLADIIAAEFEK